MFQKHLKCKEADDEVQIQIECIADRWEVIPSISLAHNGTMLSIRFAWICFELSFVVLTFRVLEMIGQKH